MAARPDQRAGFPRSLRCAPKHLTPKCPKSMPPAARKYHPRLTRQRSGGKFRHRSDIITTGESSEIRAIRQFGMGSARAFRQRFQQNGSTRGHGSPTSSAQNVQVAAQAWAAFSSSVSLQTNGGNPGELTTSSRVRWRRCGRPSAGSAPPDATALTTFNDAAGKQPGPAAPDADLPFRAVKRTTVSLCPRAAESSRRTSPPGVRDGEKIISPLKGKPGPTMCM